MELYRAASPEDLPAQRICGNTQRREATTPTTQLRPPKTVLGVIFTSVGADVSAVPVSPKKLDEQLNLENRLDLRNQGLPTDRPLSSQSGTVSWCHAPAWKTWGIEEKFGPLD